MTKVGLSFHFFTVPEWACASKVACKAKDKSSTVAELQESQYLQRLSGVKIVLCIYNNKCWRIAATYLKQWLTQVKQLRAF